MKCKMAGIWKWMHRNRWPGITAWYGITVIVCDDRCILVRLAVIRLNVAENSVRNLKKMILFILIQLHQLSVHDQPPYDSRKRHTSLISSHSVPPYLQSPERAPCNCGVQNRPGLQHLLSHYHRRGCKIFCILRQRKSLPTKKLQQFKRQSLSDLHSQAEPGNETNVTELRSERKPYFYVLQPFWNGKAAGTW